MTHKKSHEQVPRKQGQQGIGRSQKINYNSASRTINNIKGNDKRKVKKRFN